VKKQFLSYGIFLFVGILIGYLFTFQKPELEIYQVEEKEIPKCYLGRCPEYQSVDVDNDSEAESVVIIPTAMTKGAGMLWIIENDNTVVFKSKEYAGIDFENTEKGFNLKYMSNWDDLANPEYSEIRYEYKDSKFEEVGI